MALWGFDTFETKDLERIMKINAELVEMGLDGLDEDMLAEVVNEIESRPDEDEFDKMDRHSNSGGVEDMPSRPML